MRHATCFTFALAVMFGCLDSTQLLASEPGLTLKELIRQASAKQPTRRKPLGSSARAVSSHMSYHAGPEMRWQSKDENGKQTEHVVRHLLVLTWFYGGEQIVLRYTVSEDGKCHDVRDVYNWAHQASRDKTLSKNALRDLRALLRMLPESKSVPPIERTVHISFQRACKWRSLTYDSSDLPDSLEEVIKILGERFETRDCHKKKQKRQ